MKFNRMGQLAGLLVAGLLVASCSDDSATKKAAKSAEPAAKTEMAAAGKASSEGFSAAQQEQIKDLVRKALVENPSILQEAAEALEAKEREAQEKQKTEALAANKDKLFRSKLSPTSGDPKGDITVVEFFDYNCPYCRKAFEALNEVMKQDKKIRVVFKEFPIFGGASQVAAKAALAAEKQGKYFELHEALLTVQSRVTPEMVFEKAEKVGIDVEQLKKDMESEYVTSSIKETRELAEQLGIRGTPAFFVGDKLIPGAPENLTGLIKAHIKDIRKNGCKNC